MDRHPTDEARMNELIEAEVERTSARYEGLFPPEVYEEMRRLLRVTLHTHPDMQRLLRGMVERELSGSETKDIRMFQAAPVNGVRANGHPAAASSRRGGR
jgi:hypothetical protein